MEKNQFEQKLIDGKKEKSPTPQLTRTATKAKNKVKSKVNEPT